MFPLLFLDTDEGIKKRNERDTDKFLDGVKGNFCIKTKRNNFIFKFFQFSLL